MAEIVASVEAAVEGGRARPGFVLPTVRELALRLEVNRNTVAKAYRRLAELGVVETSGRGGSKIASQNVKGGGAFAPFDLANGNPDPSLLPSPEMFRRLRHGHRNYEDPDLPALLALGRGAFEADGMPVGGLSLANGAFDAISRILTSTLARDATVAVEDPCFVTTAGLLHNLGLAPVPMATDAHGVLPDAFAAALATGAAAAILTPRAQNPTGSAWTRERCEELKRVVAAYPSVVLMEDDHFAGLSLHAPRSLAATHRGPWAVVRSVSKSLGADMRMAFVNAEPRLAETLRNHTAFSNRWVSNVVQTAVLSAMGDASFPALLERASLAYAERRRWLVEALDTLGVPSSGDDGINVWVGVHDEHITAAALLAKGWLVRPGSPMRILSPPALRVTVSALSREMVPRLAADLASAIGEAGLAGTA